MAKQIYNYELFTNKKDELAKIRKKAARNAPATGTKDKDIAAGVDLSGNSDSRLYSF